MPGWIVQPNPYVPAALNKRVWDALAKSGMSPVPSPASAAFLPAASAHVTLWKTLDEFCHVTVVPLFTDRVVGEKVLAPDRQNVFAGHVGGGGGGGGGGGETPPSPPPPHEIAVNARKRTPNKPEIFRILPPRRAETAFAVSDRTCRHG
jgi:hypothetical protein